MVVGHVATALAAKKIDHRPSLGIYMFAACFADILFSILLIGGFETAEIVPGHTAMVPFVLSNYPYSHSLLGAGIAGILLGGAYWFWRRRLRSAITIVALVLGHWVLDVVSHSPDVPVGLSGPYLGLGLWNSIAATFAVEGLLFAIGIFIYARVTKPKGRIGRWAFVGYIGLLSFAYFAGPFGDPPPSITVLIIANNVACWVTVLWAAAFDRYREPV
jgi:hypothetical protein